MCGDKPLPLAKRKRVSLHYLSIVVEERGIPNNKNPHIMIDNLTTAEFGKL